MTRKVTILFGAPGTGKTTRLLTTVEKALKAGVPPTRIAYLAFTRKAAYEAIARAKEQFNFGTDDLPWFRTLHSTAFKLLELKKNEIMSANHYRRFGDECGYLFDGAYDENTERVPIDVNGVGDRCLTIYSRAKARGISIEQEWRDENGRDLTLATVNKFVKDLQSYKEKQTLYDFTDIIDVCQETLDVDLFILDEAQDNTTQQWSFARRLARDAKEVYLAGDDDQSIYSWAGATYLPLLSLNGIREVLPKSYRLPIKIKSLADGISHRIKRREEKVFSSKDIMGNVHWINEPDSVSLKSGTWMLLGRNRSQLNELAQIARNQGVVYFHQGKWSNADPSVKAVVQYERLRRNEILNATEARAVQRFVPGLQLPPDHFTWERFEWPVGYENRPDWMTGLVLSSYDKEYIRGLRRRGESLTKPGRVLVSTVHGVKGGEADNVLLLTDISRRVAESAWTNPDDEERVLYVGVTRAKESLYLAMPKTRHYWSVA
jgi:DNA helicase-2/ATP-dependent DNA helicase PcrA